MSSRESHPSPRRRRPPAPRRLMATAGLIVASAALAACGGDDKGPHLALSAAVPDAAADGTVLRVGDPATQVALEQSGLDEELDVEVEWANISGGPKTLEAFRADAIDIGSVADIPPLFAHWTGTEVRIVAARESADPEKHPVYELGVAPGADVKTTADLAGKKIAYSPGQAQGALVLNVLRAAGLSQDDVELIEMQSVDDVFANALASKQVDVAPLGQSLAQHLPREVRARRRHDHRPRRPRRRLDALRADHRARGRRQGRRDQGVRRASGPRPSSGSTSIPTSSPRPTTWSTRASLPRTPTYLVEAIGQHKVPTNWDDFIARHQETVDVLVEEQQQEPARRRRPLRPPLREGHRRGRGGDLMTTITAPRPAPAREPRRRRWTSVRCAAGWAPATSIRFGALIGPLVLLLLWSLGSATGLLDERTLSAPWTVVSTAGDLIESGRLQESLLVSAARAFLGLALGVAVGTVLALVSGLSRIGESLIDGPVQVKRSIPTLALIPLLVLWLGIGEEFKVLTIALGVFVPVYIHTHNGLRTIEGRYAELAETIGVSRAAFVRHVVLPGAMPGFLLGMRFAVTSSLLALVVVEQFNTTSGIGHMISLAANYGQTDIIVVGLVVYALLGLVADGSVRLIERKALSWRRTLAS